MVGNTRAYSHALPDRDFGELIAALPPGSTFGGNRETNDAWNRLLIARCGADLQHDA
jgi:hypothetical protein